MIKDIERADMPALALLYKAFWNEDSNVEKMYNQFDRLCTNSAYIFLGCFDDNKKLIGTVMGIICEELYGDCNPFMVLENMVVNTNMQGLGIGRQLIAELEKHAVLHECSQIILVTEKARIDACAFYESVGFSKENAGYKKKLS